MENSLGKKITFFSLIRLTLPTIIMMMFFSLYTIIDGIFISRFVGSNALSATNIIYPAVNILLGIGTMFATGGSAIIAKLMGEKRDEEAREGFSLLIITLTIIGIIIACAGLTFIKPLIYALGCTDILYDYAKEYLSIMLMFAPVIILKMFFDYFFVTAGKAKLGLISSVLGGITNIVLDYVFIAVLNMGVAGAAYATCIGYILPSLIGAVYFTNKKHHMHFVKPKFNFKLILNSSTNGFSEMVTQISSAVTTYLYNIAMLKFLGEDGVAAITIVLYAQFLLVSAYLGFTSGISPRISYNYGKKDKCQLRSIIKNSCIFIGILAIATFISAKLGADIIVTMFAGKDNNLYYITLQGFNLFIIMFLMCGFNIFTSGMFTAFSNGKISAFLSFLRTFVFFVIGIIILPSLIGVDGVWLVVPCAEALSFVISVIYILKYRKVYGYGK